MSNLHVHISDNEVLLKSQLSLYKKAVIILLAAVVLSLGLFLAKIFSPGGLISKAERGQKDYTGKAISPAPYTKEVEEIIRPLEYSGVQAFSEGNVYLSLDPVNRAWTLHNLRHFDDQGNVVLVDNKYGTCGELASYVYRKIYPLFHQDYEIEFVRAAQAGFFLEEKSSHIVLEIKKRGVDSGTEEAFILDPSFGRYGPISEFEDYLFFERMPELLFVQNRNTSMTLGANGSIPLLIRREYLLSFAVEGMNDKFDRQNFIIALTLTKQNNFAGRYVFALRKQDGQDSMLENRILVTKGLISAKEYELLRDKVSALFEKAVD